MGKSSMNVTMTIELKVLENGGVMCGAWWENPPQEPEGIPTIAVGALELAKASLIAGRWGVRDAQDAISGRGFKPEDYMRAHMMALEQLTKEREDAKKD